jgi:hypothetical protein
MGRSRRARSSASQCSARPSAQRSPRLTQRRVRMPRDVGRLWSCLRAAAGSCCGSIVRAAALALPGVVDVISAADVKALGCSNSLTGSGSVLLHPRNVHVGCVRLDSHGRPPRFLSLSRRYEIFAAGKIAYYGTLPPLNLTLRCTPTHTLTCTAHHTGAALDGPA